jgi:uncharacterized membrane protein
MVCPGSRARLVRRARIQLVLAVVCGLLTILAAVTPMWIEEFTSLEPDGGNGVLEWLLSLPFGVAALLGGLTYRTRRRLAAA